jgi:hypothetical protein
MMHQNSRLTIVYRQLPEPDVSLGLVISSVSTVDDREGRLVAATTVVDEKGFSSGRLLIADSNSLTRKRSEKA